MTQEQARCPSTAVLVQYSRTEVQKDFDSPFPCLCASLSFASRFDFARSCQWPDECLSPGRLDANLICFSSVFCHWYCLSLSSNSILE